MTSLKRQTSVAMTLCLSLPAFALPAAAQPLSPPALSAAPLIAAQVVGSDTAGSYIYEIGPDDRLSITVRGEDDLSREIDVRPDGFITLPLIGDINAVGRTSEALAKEIEDAYRRYLTDPVVSIAILSASGTYQDRIRVIGSAMSPRTVPYREDRTVLSVLTDIGGIPPTAAANKAYIIRKVDGREKHIPLHLADIQSGRDLDADQALLPGDIIVIPESILAGERTVSPSLTVAQSYTDNLNLRRTQKEGSFITEIVPALQLRYDTARIRAAMDAELRLQYRTNTQDELSLAPDVNATSNLEIVENVFFTDLAASVSRQLTDTRRGQSSTVSNIENTQTVQVYKVSPYLENRLGQFAILETRYRGGLVLISEAEPDPLNPDFPGGRPASDTFENTGIVTLKSPSRGGNLFWQILGQYSHFDQKGRENRERKEVIANIDYALTESLTLLARGGYQKFSGRGFGQEVDDPLYMAGLRWSPSPRTSIEVTAGQRDGKTTVQGSLFKAIGQSLALTASYEERVEIDQERLIGNLPESPDQFDPTRPPGLPFPLRGTPTRTETAQVNLTGSFDVNTITLHGSWQASELGIDDTRNNEEVITARISYSRPLSRVLTFDAFASYTERDFSAQQPGGLPREDKDYRGNAGLSYLGFRRFILSLNYGISTRDSTADFQNFTENSVSLSATMRF